jgi:hypothetical protein
MIRVDNSHKTRLFTNTFSNKIDDLKIRVANKILEIEEGSRDYNELAMFDSESCLGNISVFLYKKKIDEAIEILLNDNDIAKEFKVELRSLKDNLFKILIGDFETIKAYLGELVNSNSKLIHRDIAVDKSEDFKKYQKRFEDLYKSQLSGNEKFKKSFFEIFENMNVCPYCNRNFINPIYKDEKVGQDNSKQAPDIEHFFPKSIYPLFALSISNLLPSCAFCNKIKSDVDTYPDSKSPYEIEEDDFKFSFDSLDVSKRTIKLESTSNNSKILNLENLYAEVHNQFVDEVYLESRKYPLENRRFLNRFFSLPLDSQERLYKRKYCNYYLEDDFNKQPLSKMTKDLFMQIREDED